ncbi:MAG TPA: hypothetical protein PLY12_08455, partial [Bacillota bacterium]|nr:hypothetical protein [Bacillota bacterium]
MRDIMADKLTKAVIGLMLLVMLLFVCLEKPAGARKVFSGLSETEDMTDSIHQIFRNRNNAIINGDLKLIQSLYDTSTKYGTWA